MSNVSTKFPTLPPRDVEEDAFFEELQQDPVLQDLTGETCEYLLPTNKVCGKSLMTWKKGAQIDDLYHCFICMKKEVCKRRKDKIELGDVIFLVHQGESVRSAMPKVLEKKIEHEEIVMHDQIESESESESSSESESDSSDNVVQDELSRQADLMKGSEDDTAKENSKLGLPHVCLYEYTKDGKTHKKGDVCGEPVTKNPIYKEDAHRCHTHPSETGNLLKKCKARVNDEPCKRNRKDDKSKFCEKCEQVIAKQEALQQKKEEKRQKRKDLGKCPRKKRSGDRKGFPCGAPITTDGEEFCNRCAKTKEVMRQRGEIPPKKSKKVKCKNDDDDDDEDDENENDDESCETESVSSSPLPLSSTSLAPPSGQKSLAPPSNPNQSSPSQILQKRLELLDVKSLPALIASNGSEIGLCAQWNYLIQVLVKGNLGQPNALAALLLWYANGRFKCDSTEDECYLEYKEKDKKWTRVPRHVRTNVDRLKQDLVTDFGVLLSKVRLRIEKYNISLREVRNKLEGHASKGVTDGVFDRFMELVVEATRQENEGKEAEGRGGEEDDDPNSQNLKQFVDLHVQPLTSKKKGVTTTTFLNTFNEWLESKGKILYKKGAAQFGKVLVAINPDGRYWERIPGDNTRHLVTFVNL
jgi:hypothetical protein